MMPVMGVSSAKVHLRESAQAFGADASLDGNLYLAAIKYVLAVIQAASAVSAAVGTSDPVVFLKALVGDESRAELTDTPICGREVRRIDRRGDVRRLDDKSKKGFR
jgi:hypothetical protein